MNFLELLPRFGILDLSRLILYLSLLNSYTLNLIAGDLIVLLPIKMTQHNKFQKFPLNSDHEFLYVLSVQPAYNLFTIIDY